MTQVLGNAYGDFVSVLRGMRHTLTMPVGITGDRNFRMAEQKYPVMHTI